MLGFARRLAFSGVLLGEVGRFSFLIRGREGFGPKLF